MTYARSQLVPPGAPGIYHCVSRCVRRAFLCGEDRYTGQSFEHRRQWLQDRLHELAEVFAVSVLAYAVMSNHLHLVVQMQPDAAAAWSEREVAERWLRLFPKADQAPEGRIDVLLTNPERLNTLRARLADLSWLMRCLCEPIARRANQEDHCKGRFWEGRFKCQALLDEAAVLAAMAYVDLNPIRAGLCDRLEDAHHTSAQRRIVDLDDSASGAHKPLLPIAGIRGLSVLAIDPAGYLELLDWTGRQLHPGKRGVITGPPPKALARLGCGESQWPRQVKAVGSDFHRAVGSVQSLLDKAAAMGQRWLQGIGVARVLATKAAS